ncbi:MAG: hypothetical protein HC877_04205 [Thioploca sp.]|nr:hypothetical protein [Thioploca sp.]
MITLPPDQTLPPILFKALFVQSQITPASNPELAYTLKQPKPWFAKNHELTNPLELTWLGSITDAEQATVSIQATSLDREISAGDWLKYYALTLGKQILTFQPTSTDLAQGLLQFEYSSDVWIERAHTVIHGQWLVLISGLAAKAVYHHLASTFKQIITSFRLLNPPVEPTIEPRTTYRLKPYQFRCPTRWQYQVVAKNTGVLSHPLGLVKITVLSQINTQAEWLEQQLDDFPQLTLQNLLHHAPLSSPNSQLPHGHLMIYQGIQSGEPKELWLSRFKDRVHWVTVALLTPTRTLAFHSWAINKRTYGIILASLQEEK